MSAALTPVARRYWFVAADTLAAIDAAEDVPAWGAGELLVTGFCRDTKSFDALTALAGADATLSIVDMRDAARFGAVLRDALDRESASYVQFAFHAVEDFTPALGLLFDFLAQERPPVIQSAFFEIGSFGMTQCSQDDAPRAESCWIETGLVRTALADTVPGSIASLRDWVATLIALNERTSRALVTGACYLALDEQPALEGAEREVALWRARVAAAWAAIDRLNTEKRVRAGREAAFKARHERDLARQTARSRSEIDRPHRAAGWAGRWRARIARMVKSS